MRRVKRWVLIGVGSDRGNRPIGAVTCVDEKWKENAGIDGCEGGFENETIIMCWAFDIAFIWLEKRVA